MFNQSHAMVGQRISPNAPFLMLNTVPSSEEITTHSVGNNGRHLVTGDGAGVLIIWDIASHAIVKKIYLPFLTNMGLNGILSLDLQKEDTLLAVSCKTSLGKSKDMYQVIVLDIITERIKATIDLSNDKLGLQVSFSPDDKWLAIQEFSVEGGDLLVFDTLNWSKKLSVYNHLASCYDHGNRCFLWTAQNKIIAMSNIFAPDKENRKSFVRLIEPHSGQVKTLVEIPGTIPIMLSVSPQGGYFSFHDVDDCVQGRLSLIVSNTAGTFLGQLPNPDYDPIWGENDTGVINYDKAFRFTTSGMSMPLSSDVIKKSVQISQVEVDRKFVKFFDKAHQLVANYERMPILSEKFRADALLNSIAFENAQVKMKFNVSERRFSPLTADEPQLLSSSDSGYGIVVKDWQGGWNTTINGNKIDVEYPKGCKLVDVLPDGSGVILGSYYWYARHDSKGKLVWRTLADIDPIAHKISSDGQMFVVHSSNRVTRWYRTADGVLLLSFYVEAIPNRSDSFRWVLWTPEGFFDASEGGAELIGYHLNQGKFETAQFVGVDKFYDLFYRPDLVTAKFQGKDISEYAKAVDVNRILTTKTLPPTVNLTTTSGTRQKRDTTIEGEVCDQGGGVGGVTLYLNDMPVVVDTEGRGMKVVHRAGKETSCRGFSHIVTLTEGRNVIGLTARNRANTIESNRAEVTFSYRSGSKERPDLYVLAIAVNKYRDGDLRLKYPIPDANDLARSIQSGGKRLFGKVVVRTVYDSEATREGVTRAFQEVGGKTRRDDVFVLFIAGHGITYEKDGNYYFLPVDFRYTGEEAIRKQGISKDDLTKNLTHIQAMKSLLLLDTCNSGSFAEAVASRNIVEKTAVTRLSKATGRSTIVASSRDQVALEGYEGHGVFTYTILKGMGGEAKDREGKVTVNGLATYVEEMLPKLTYKKWGYEQIPQKSLQGMDFPLALH
ncbi:MAG: caspase family protein [Syntrophales bacterium]